MFLLLFIFCTYNKKEKRFIRFHAVRYVYFTMLERRKKNLMIFAVDKKKERPFVHGIHFCNS